VKTFGQLSMLYQSGNTSLLTVSQDKALGDTAAFTTFDSSMGGELRNKTTVEFYVNNIFNEHGVLSRNSQCIITTCLLNGRSYPIKPQLFGVKFGQRF
jgi:hypothetical protein